MTVRLPSLPEQHGIAAVLETADTEITPRRDLIAQLCARKHDFLEQLLTGELRVPLCLKLSTPPPL